MLTATMTTQIHTSQSMIRELNNESSPSANELLEINGRWLLKSQFYSGMGNLNATYAPITFCYNHSQQQALNGTVCLNKIPGTDQTFVQLLSQLCVAYFDVLFEKKICSVHLPFINKELLQNYEIPTLFYPKETFLLLYNL